MSRCAASAENSAPTPRRTRPTTNPSQSACISAATADCCSTSMRGSRGGDIVDSRDPTQRSTSRSSASRASPNALTKLPKGHRPAARPSRNAAAAGLSSAGAGLSSSTGQASRRTSGPPRPRRPATRRRLPASRRSRRSRARLGPAPHGGNAPAFRERATDAAPGGGRRRRSRGGGICRAPSVSAN